MRTATHCPLKPDPTLGVVIPTLDCARFLEDHLASMEEWLDMADEIVVVDSYSSDGTWQKIQGRLKGPKTSFHQRARGLYQSWNYGISQLTTDFAYFSTVGDGITRAGLEHLKTSAVALGADVVVSPPAFVAEDGSPSERPPDWPIHQIIRTQHVDEPALIDNWVLLLLALENPADAILGSSASNLYRTRLLKEMPFPVDFGTVGDGAWGLSNMFGYKLAATAECFSFFREHGKAHAGAVFQPSDLNHRLFNLLVERLKKIMHESSLLKHRAEELECMELVRLVVQRMRWQAKLEKARQMPIPWQINPLAWRSRKLRNGYRAQARRLRDAGLQRSRRGVNGKGLAFDRPDSRGSAAQIGDNGSGFTVCN